MHRAHGLAKADATGSSDPYINIAFSRLGRPIYSTRVIVNDLEPIFEETAAVLVTVEAVKAGEKIAAELWDSDRFSAGTLGYLRYISTYPESVSFRLCPLDDRLGKVEVPIHDLIRTKGQIHHRCDNLIGTKEGTSMPGQLKWSVAFYPLAPLNQSLRTTGSDPRLPEDLKKLEGLDTKDKEEAKSEIGGVTTIPVRLTGFGR